jgi:hypothetical protein
MQAGIPGTLTDPGGVPSGPGGLNLNILYPRLFSGTTPPTRRTGNMRKAETRLSRMI